MEELISVIVPCYNIELLVSNAVQSIQNQTHSNLEIILVDDGSTDGTLEVLQQMSSTDNRIHVVHQENGGVTKARLTGVAVATGRWIGFVDGDDWIEPEMYEILLRNAQQYHAGISHCGYQMVFPNRVDYYYNTGRVVQQDNLAGVKDLLEASFIEPSLCNKLYHHTLFYSLLHASTINLSVKNNEDLLMNFYLFRQVSNSVYEDFCPYHYMVRNGSAAKSGLNQNQLKDPIIVLEEIRKETEEAELRDIVNRRLLARYISNATLPLGNQTELVIQYRGSAINYIRKNIGGIVNGNYSKREKLMAVWVNVWPASYAFAHRLYNIIKGTDHKYDVD